MSERKKKIIRNPKKFEQIRPKGVKDKPQATDTQHGKKNNENRTVWIGLLLQESLEK